MNKTLLLATAAFITLAGCQSTSMTPEEEAISANLCTTGDGSGATYTMEAYKTAVMECGGYEIFTEDMLIDKTLNFAFNKGKKKRSMTLSEGGTATYTKVEKGTSENISWTLTDQGNLRLEFEDGYAWDWTLMTESDNYLAVKSMGWTADGSEKDILSMVVAVTAAVQ
ncbi:hypothetical protein [uncultured Vibrio sp.]|uniref:hypothetical protein n=1 Tax=uncultured Vibrio sp. TaxID=114054 RepID=UPI0025D6A237|nr:hypothetical protein [uncultured Vibrio sp.]